MRWLRRLCSHLPGCGRCNNKRKSGNRSVYLYRMQTMQPGLFLQGNSVMGHLKKYKPILYALCIVCSIVAACVNAPKSTFGPTDGAYLSVDSGLCGGCRKCIQVCPADAITFLNNKAVIDPTKCIKCFKCIDACPYDAIY